MSPGEVIHGLNRRCRCCGRLQVTTIEHVYRLLGSLWIACSPLVPPDSGDVVDSRSRRIKIQFVLGSIGLGRKVIEGLYGAAKYLAAQFLQ